MKARVLFGVLAGLALAAIVGVEAQQSGGFPSRPHFQQVFVTNNAVTGTQPGIVPSAGSTQGIVSIGSGVGTLFSPLNLATHCDFGGNYPTASNTALDCVTQAGAATAGFVFQSTNTSAGTYPYIMIANDSGVGPQLGMSRSASANCGGEWNGFNYQFMPLGPCNYLDTDFTTGLVIAVNLQTAIALTGTDEYFGVGTTATPAAGTVIPYLHAQNLGAGSGPVTVTFGDNTIATSTMNIVAGSTANTQANGVPIATVLQSVLASDQTIASNTGFNCEVTLALAASATYHVDAIAAVASGAGGIDAGLGYSGTVASPAGFWTAVLGSNGTFVGAAFRENWGAGVVLQVNAAAGGTSDYIHMTGVLVTSTAGNLCIGIGQVSSNAAVSTIKAGSSLVVTRVH